MSAMTRVDTGPMAYAPPDRTRPLRLVAPGAARQPQDLDAGFDEHQEISSRALANLAAEVSSLALANTMQGPDNSQIIGAIEQHQRSIEQIDAEVARELEEGDRLRQTAARLKAAYEEAMAPLVDALNAQARREAHLRRDYERRLVRMQPKRARSKRT